MTKQMIQNIIVMILFLVLIAYAGNRYLLGPQKIKYNDAWTKLDQTQKKLAEMQQRALDLPRLRAEKELLDKEVAELEKLLPLEKEIPQLLRSMTRTAQQYQLKITQITPQAVVPQTNYNELPFLITMQGSYHSLGHFLGDMGQGGRLLSSRNLTISPIGATKNGPTNITATFVLVAYTFKG